MNPRATSQYDILVGAAQTVKKELGFFTDDSDSDNDGDLDDEICFLGASLEYYKRNGIYPFGTSRATEDFCKNWVKMTPGDFHEEYPKLRKKYKKRVRKICKKFELLEPREQEAFELGNKIWGSRSGGKREDDVTMLSAEDSSSREEDFLARFSFLKETFKFGGNNSNALMMPVLPDDVVKEGLVMLGSPKMKEWNENWKKIRIEEIKIFLERVNMIREQAMFLLAAIE